MLIKWIVFVYLLWMSMCDIKERRISVPILAMGSFMAILFSLYEIIEGRDEWIQPLLGLFPGLVLLAIAWLSKKAGYADGIVLLWPGIMYGYMVAFAILCISLMLISLVSIVLLMLGKVKRQSQIPYIPFLTMGFVVVHLIGVLE